MTKQPESDGIKKLYLSDTDKKLSGVCGGIGEYFNIDATLVRLSWIFVTVVTGLFPGVVAYIVAAVVIPQKPDTPAAE
jgi:phage shock protein C